MLVGHSLGGVLIRGFSARYPNETAGLVYLDTPDFEATREQRAAVLTGEARDRALKPPSMPAIPDDTPAKLRPVYEQLLLEMANDFPSARDWRQPSNIPVGVIVTVEPTTRFAFRWGSEDRPLEPGQSTLVEFMLTPSGDGGTTLTVLESGFASLHNGAEQIEQNTGGWREQFENIARYLASA